MTARREALRRAAAFVAEHGDPLQQRAAAALLGETPAKALLEVLPVPEDVESALCALRLLTDLGDPRALASPAAERTCAVLARLQAPDGGFGDVATTAAVAAQLARTRLVRPRTLDAAAAFLAAHWSPERVRQGDWAALAGYAAFFANVDHELADAALQWCGRELSRGFATGNLEPVRVARVLLDSDAHALPGAPIASERLVAALLGSQQPDGGWPSPAPRAATTLDALVALLRLP